MASVLACGLIEVLPGDLVLLADLAVLEDLVPDLEAVLSWVLAGLIDLEAVPLLPELRLLAALVEEVAFAMAEDFFALALESAAFATC